MRKSVLSVLFLCFALCLTMLAFSACDSDDEVQTTTTTTTPPSPNPLEQGPIRVQDFGNYMLVFISNGDGTASAGVFSTNPDCTENFTVTFPEKSPVGDTVTAVCYIHHVQTTVEGYPIIPCIMTATDWESKINAPLTAAKDAGTIDEYSYEKFKRCFEKKSLSDCQTEPGLENMLEDYPMTLYTDIYVLKPAASTVQLDWISIRLAEYAGFTAETPQMLLQNVLSAVDGDPYVTLSLLSTHFSSDHMIGIELPDSIVSIEWRSFFGYTALTSIHIPASVTSIGEDAFYGCYRLTEVYNQSALPIQAGRSDYGYVGYYANNVYTEAGGNKLSITPDGWVLYTDGEEVLAIDYIGSATEITVPSTVTGIDRYAFYRCTSLKSLIIGDSVTHIDVSAFEGCTSLTSITIGESIGCIEDGAFLDCTGLMNVYYRGTTDSWKKIDGVYSSNNTCLANAHRYYYSENRPETEESYWHYVDGVPTKW